MESLEDKPKCPDCDARGIYNIVSIDSVQKSKGGDTWFDVVICRECGHVYGVFNKVSLGPSVTVPKFNF